MTPLHGQRSGQCQVNRRSSTVSNSSSDEDDAITPCPLEKTPSKSHKHEQKTFSEQCHNTTPPQRPSSWRDSQQWHFDPLDADAEEVDPSLLWRRMLTIQRIFGCYNSARMRAALETGVEDDFVPSKTCLDLLNDSISQLPEDSRRQLDEYLNNESCSRRRTSSWKRRLLHGPS